MTHQLVKLFLNLFGPWDEVHHLIFKFLVHSPVTFWLPDDREIACAEVLYNIGQLGVDYDKPKPWAITRTSFVAEMPDDFGFCAPLEIDSAEDDEESIETVVRSESMEAVVTSDVSVSSDSHSENEIAPGRRLTRGQMKHRRTRFHPEGR